MEIRFPRLGRLHPTVESTILKLSEEVGERSREITRNPGSREGVISELLDVAQTCATLTFLVQNEDMSGSVKAHLWKLYDKGYLKKVPDVKAFGVVQREGEAAFVLPPLDISPTLESTFFKLTEEAGELAQAAGTRRGLSGRPQAFLTSGLPRHFSMWRKRASPCSIFSRGNGAWTSRRFSRSIARSSRSTDTSNRDRARICRRIASCRFIP